MKILRKSLLAIVIFCSTFGMLNVGEPSLLASGAIQVFINGTEMAADVPPLLDNGRTLVPMRAIGERLGCSVAYDTTTKKVTLHNQERVILLTVNQKKAYINGEEQLLDVPAKVVNGRTVVPLRFVGQSLNAKVEWDGNTQTITITTEEIKDSSENAPSYPAVWKDSATWEQELLILVNKARTDIGLKPLNIAKDLATLAREHSRDMAIYQYFDHNSPVNGTAEQRMTKAGLPLALENIAHGYMSATDTFNALMASPTHRSNILHPKGVFFGAGAYSLPTAEGQPTDVFVTMNIITSESFFVAARNQTVTGDSVNLTGYTTKENVDITAFLLVDGKDDTYAEKKTFYATVNGEEFSSNVKFWKAGKYIINIGSDNFIITKE